MGVSIDSPEGGDNGWLSPWSTIMCLTRRKQVNSGQKNSQGQLAKELSVLDLIGIGNSLQKHCYIQSFF